jgi:putative membrane protein
MIDMKKLSIVFMLAGAFFIGCNGNNGDNGSGTTDTSNTNSSKDSTDSTRGDKPSDTSASQASSTPPSQESKDFVTKAASGGMLEVQLGQLAQQNAKSQRVKDFGSMMVTDHSKANDELKSLASSTNVTVPTALLPQHQKHLDMMRKMKGDAFDKHYMDMMVNDHKEDIGDFKKEANSSTNDVFKGFASKTLPVLQKHLDSAQAIHGKM